MPNKLRRIILIFFTLILILATITSIQLARADLYRKKPDLQSIVRSTELDPLNSLGFFTRATREEQLGISSQRSWKRAIELNPRSAQILIQAGISAEMRGDNSAAENLYLEAEKYNTLWLPRWTLANYYIRQDQPEKALFWIREALYRARGNDLSGIYTLAEMAGANPEKILNQILPPTPVVYAGYMGWIVRGNLTPEKALLLEKAATTYIDLTSDWQSPKYPGPVVFAASHLIRNSYGTASKRLWNKACAEKIIDCPSTTGDGLISNGDFLKPFLNTPLDWNLPIVPGVTATHQPGSGTVKYSFSGEQGETFPLLSQTLNIAPYTSWTVKFEFQTRGISDSQGQGFNWQLGIDPLPIKRSLSSEGWKELSFNIGPYRTETVEPLLLIYTRRPGTIRPQGDLWIRNIRAEKLKK